MNCEILSVSRSFKNSLKIMNYLILGRQATEEEKEAIAKCNEILGNLTDPLEIIGTRPKDR